MMKAKLSEITKKKDNKAIVCKFIAVLAIPVILFYIIYSTLNTVAYYENIDPESISFISFPKGCSRLSIYHKSMVSIYECQMTEDLFWVIAKRESWRMAPITKPIKMLRYNYTKTSERDFEYQCQMLTPASESDDCCFHFIKNGFYYINENSPTFIHAAYDTDGNKLFVYSVNIGNRFGLREAIPMYKLDPSVVVQLRQDKSVEKEEEM